MGVEHATIGVILLTLALVLPVLHYIKRAKNSPESLYVRRIPGIAAVDEAIGRSVELGRPVSFTSGSSPIGPTLYACLGVLYYVARRCAVFKNKLVVPQHVVEPIVIIEDTLQEAYRAEGRSSLYDPKTVVFLSEEQFAYAAGYGGLISREKIGAAFLFGNFAAESLLLAEAGQSVGALQVAATVSPEQVAFFVCTCDYTLIGEELYAASAYLTREPVQLGSLLAQDRAKMLVMAIILIGVFISTLNSINPSLRIPNVGKALTYDLWGGEE